MTNSYSWDDIINPTPEQQLIDRVINNFDFRTVWKIMDAIEHFIIGSGNALESEKTAIPFLKSIARVLITDTAEIVTSDIHYPSIKETAGFRCTIWKTEQGEIESIELEYIPVDFTIYKNV